MKRHNSKVTILLVGTPNPNTNTISVWCPYCKCYHTHGWDMGNASNDVEHRVPHYDPKISPLPDARGAYHIGIAPDPYKYRG